jgi:ABC-type Fe3+ transport system substrate-binding protein
MVFVFWDERYRAFAGKYKAATFATVRSALGEQGGWAAIANRPDWGLFKFGHTHPGQSNSGVMTLVAMAYEFRGKSRGLELSDILDPSFQSAMAQVERGVTGLANSTGTMMREMVLKGPSSFDALFVYENIAIEYLKSAEGRWGSLRVVYPALNLWNENPYYVLDAPWSDRRQREAAGAFLDFLMSEPIQKQALTHGFRPGNPTVPVRTPDSPFTLYARQGLQVDLGTVCEPPRAEVVANLLQSWQRQFAR